MVEAAETETRGRGTKSAGAFRTISEVSAELDVPQHVLRFWETKFPQIKPLKRGGGRRYYRPDDVDLLRSIQVLLYKEGYTIKGVQRLLKESRGSPVPRDTGDDGSAADRAVSTGLPDEGDEGPDDGDDDLSDEGGLTGAGGGSGDGADDDDGEDGVEPAPTAGPRPLSPPSLFDSAPELLMPAVPPPRMTAGPAPGPTPAPQSIPMALPQALPPLGDPVPMADWPELAPVPVQTGLTQAQRMALEAVLVDLVEIRAALDD